MSKQDIIETVEKSIKSAMSKDAKFQAKNRSTGKEFKPSYKPVHYAAKPVQETAEIVIPNEDMIVGLLVEYVRNGLQEDLQANFRYIAYELSAKLSNVILAHNRHSAYIMGR